MTVDLTKPRFTHDCDRCIFLGQDGRYDLWFCPITASASGTTVIARYGNNGPAYMSGLEVAKAIADAEPDHPLVRAMRLAEERGLIKKKEST